MKLLNLTFIPCFFIICPTVRSMISTVSNIKLKNARKDKNCLWKMSLWTLQVTRLYTRNMYLDILYYKFFVNFYQFIAVTIFSLAFIKCIEHKKNREIIRLENVLKGIVIKNVLPFGSFSAAVLIFHLWSIVGYIYIHTYEE